MTSKLNQFRSFTLQFSKSKFSQGICYQRQRGLKFIFQGPTLEKKEKFNEAIINYDHALQINPNDARIYMNKGVALKKLGNFNEAIRMYDFSIQLNPNDAETYTNKGVALSDLGKFNEAIQMHDLALSINPRFAKAYDNKLILLRNLGRFEEEIRIYDILLQLNPKNVETYINKVALSNLKKFDEALKMYDRALQIKPNYEKIYKKKGIRIKQLQSIALQKLKNMMKQFDLRNLCKFDEAIKYDHAIKINPNEAQTYIEKGDEFEIFQEIALRHIGKFDEAIQMNDHPLQMNPNDAKKHDYELQNILRNFTKRSRQIQQSNKNAYSCYLIKSTCCTNIYQQTNKGDELKHFKFLIQQTNK